MPPEMRKPSETEMRSLCGDPCAHSNEHCCSSRKTLPVSVKDASGLDWILTAISSQHPTHLSPGMLLYTHSCDGRYSPGPQTSAPLHVLHPISCASSSRPKLQDLNHDTRQLDAVDEVVGPKRTTRTPRCTARRTRRRCRRCGSGARLCRRRSRRGRGPRTRNTTSHRPRSIGCRRRS